MKDALLFLLFALSHSLLIGQNFENSSLEGIPVSPYVLDGWETVPITDPFCLATTVGHATPIITTHFNPLINTSIFGTPHSGETFLSGLYAELSAIGTVYHKGMHQVVDGFTIGENYTLQFFQCVVKQFGAQDTSGAWDIYMNDTFLATSEVSTSQLDYDDPNLQWEERKIEFTAPSESISFKFLVKDDDDEHSISSTVINGAVRMGIDDITLFSCANSPLNPIDPQSIVFSEDSICVGEEVQISNWPEGFSATCQWEFSDGQIFSSCALPALSFSSPGNISATLQMTDMQGCAFNFTSDELVVLPNPVAHFDMNPESISLTSPLVHFENHSENADAFFWDFGNGENSTQTHPIHTFLNTEEGTSEICLEAFSDFGCASQLCKDLEIDDPLEIYIPNSFSPDQDGLNDYWQVHLSGGSLSVYEVRITNRWGQLIWSSDDPNEKWDGRGAKESDYFSPSGTYIYQLTCQEFSNSKSHKRTGHITLFR